MSTTNPAALSATEWAKRADEAAREIAGIFYDDPGRRYSAFKADALAIILKHLPAARVGEDGAQTSEAYFADKDLFCRYVHEQVNPARLKEGLSVFNDSAINRLYDIAMQGTHRSARSKGTEREGQT